MDPVRLLGRRPGVLTTIELARKALPSVVSVIVEDANGRVVRFGSGFFVRGDVLATNYHVIETAADVSKITAKIAGKNEVYGIQEILGADEKKDLALLRVTGIKGRPLPLGTTRQVAIGEAVYAVGSPKGLEGTFSPGIVSSIRQHAGQDLIQITAPVSHGSSGGPVLSSNGEVVGIIAMGIEEGQNLNFAIPVKYLSSLIKESLVTDKQTLADSHVDRGDRYREQKLLAKSLDAYKQAIRIQPDNREAYFGLGVAYYDMHRYVEAVQAYKQAIRIAPDEDLFYLLGNAQENLGRFSEAAEAYKQSIRIHPMGESYYGLGDCSVKLGNYELAIESYKQAIQIYPKARLYLYGSLGDVFLKLGRNAEAIENYKEVVPIEPTAYRYSSLGDVFLKLGRDAEAIEAYKQRAHNEPSAANYSNLLDLYRRLGRYPEAIEVYKEVIRIEPVGLWADPTTREMGFMYEALNRYAEAAEIYMKDAANAAKKRNEHEARRAQSSLGRTYYEMGRYDKAMEVYNGVIRTKPNYAYAHHMLGKVYLKLGRSAAAKLRRSQLATLATASHS